MRQPHPVPGAVTLEVVRAGNRIAVPVEGGFVRRPATDDGVVVHTEDTALFVAWEALDALRRRSRR